MDQGGRGGEGMRGVGVNWDGTQSVEQRFKV